MQNDAHFESTPQAGFTLVELAIVMIIIGLLIGGVLKGQQLITNAQVTSQVAQIKSIDAATTSFLDEYGAMAGDIINPSTRVPNCTVVPCSAGGDGDGRVDTGGGNGINFGFAPAGEQLGYWAQLSAAGLITGVNPTLTTPKVWGGYYPASKINGGGLDIGWNAGCCNWWLGNVSGPPTENLSGLYIAVHGTANAGVSAFGQDGFMTQSVAQRLDTKLDDGQPNSGVVLAVGGPSATGCASNATTTAVYNESVGTATCALYIKISN